MYLLGGKLHKSPRQQQDSHHKSGKSLQTLCSWREEKWQLLNREPLPSPTSSLTSQFSGEPPAYSPLSHGHNHPCQQQRNTSLCVCVCVCTNIFVCLIHHNKHPGVQLTITCIRTHCLASDNALTTRGHCSLVPPTAGTLWIVLWT